MPISVSHPSQIRWKSWWGSEQAKKITSSTAPKGEWGLKFLQSPSPWLKSGSTTWRCFGKQRDRVTTVVQGLLLGASCTLEILGNYQTLFTHLQNHMHHPNIWIAWSNLIGWISNMLSEYCFLKEHLKCCARVWSEPRTTHVNWSAQSFQWFPFCMPSLQLKEEVRNEASQELNKFFQNPVADRASCIFTLPSRSRACCG